MARVSLKSVVGGGYKQFWECKSRYLVCKGSRASKKSKTAALRWIYLLMKHPQANLLCVRKTYRTIQDSQYTDLKWAANRLGVSHLWSFTKSPLEATYEPTGQKILFRGLTTWVTLNRFNSVNVLTGRHRAKSGNYLIRCIMSHYYKGGIMYLVYLFREKKSGKVIYVGSSARPAARMKEHVASAEGQKPSNMKLYGYMRDNNLKFYKDVEVVWVDRAENEKEMRDLEALYYYKYEETLLNDRPAEYRNGECNPKRKGVRCLDDGMEFNSVLQCSEYYGIPRTTLTNHLTGRRKKFRNSNLRFEYIDRNV